jgi:hypothetical protein
MAYAVAFDNYDGAKAAFVVGNRRVVPVKFTADSSYPALGYLLKPSDFGLNVIETVVATSTSCGATVYFDAATGKLRVFCAVALEAATSGDISSLVAHLLVIGV